jgi:hypothetical protein
MSNYSLYHRNKQRAIDYLGGCCANCGSTARLEFDHTNRDRIGDENCITQLLGYSWDTILAELSKCQLLCYPCHKDKTRAERAVDRATRALHGSLTKYRYGCRCEACATVHKSYMKAYREKRLAMA